MSSKYKKSERRKPRDPLDPQVVKEDTLKSQKEMDTLCKLFWENKPYVSDLKINHELEIKFSTIRNSPRILRNDYDNVIKQMLSLGFTSSNMGGEYLMRISNEYLDPKRGKFEMSNIRTEIKGFTAIQQYCKNNDIITMIDSQTYGQSVSMQKKDDITKGGERLYPVTFRDFNFRCSYKQEENYNIVSRFGLVKDIIENWVKTKKTFRYLNRVTFVHPDYPVNIDISIVKTSRLDENGNMERTYTTSEANVFNSDESYEVEIEIDNSRIGPGTTCDNVALMVDKLKKCIKFVMMGLQETNYPISISEQQGVARDYLKLIKSQSESTRLFPSNFVGPSSYTLQLNNIVEDADNEMNMPNIRKEYTVTDKADGERRIMYVSKNGKIYLLNTNMKILFTGAKTNNEKCYNSLLDGEIIFHDKNGKYINLFAGFDIYIKNKIDVRHHKFYVHPDEEEEKLKSRLFELNGFIKDLNVVSISTSNSSSPIRVSTKQFYASSDKVSIFTGCSTILKRVGDGLFEYNTDGLIFTPTLLGVGSSKIGESGPLRKTTWSHSFKWKPAEFNTIDFMVTTTKDDSGKDIKHTIFESGVNAATTNQYKQYKTITLRCGFNEKEHGYINPCQDVLDDNLPEFKDDDKDVESKYGPQQFFPTDPYDASAGLCNLMLRQDNAGNQQMYTEENEVIEDNTIVEFRYDITRESEWRWVPLRVRYDKTSELRRGLPNFGNAYHVANSNWHSIHNPITQNMIVTGRDIPKDDRNDDVYYNRTSSISYTRGLRDFHNLYVKMRLITSVARKGDTLIDFACGKGGDFSKWIDAKLSFVFGIDLSPDNIENRLDGACARYLSHRKKRKNVPGALFVNGDSGYNIRSGQAMKNEKAKQITASVFGNIAKDNKLGKGVTKHYAIGEDGFNISSCQFALHYFFKSKHVLHRFVANIAECTKIGGYFVGACYDGKKIFNMLKDKAQGEEIELYHNTKKIWGVQKLYTNEEFNDDNTSLNYKIKVYQETINKSFDEYLVNFDYFVRIMENYGFQVIQDQDAADIGFPSGLGLFEELFQDMNKKIKTNPRTKGHYGTAQNMSDNEKEISFKNRYFIFKKTSNVNIDRVVAEEEQEEPISNIIERVSSINNTSSVKEKKEIDSEKSEKSEKSKKKEKTPKTIIVKRPRKLNKSIILQESSK
jgi:hypothetical protein